MSPTENITLEPRRTARVGQTPRRAKKKFLVAFEDLDPEYAAAVGLAPGQTAEVEYWFTWKPYGWAALRQWLELAARTSNTPQTQTLCLGLEAIIQNSNFGLEDKDYDALDDRVMSWVLLETGLYVPKRKPDPKEQGQSQEEKNTTP